MTKLRAAVTSWDDVPWGDWRPGEHVTAVGPTGSGKSHAVAALVGQRRWSVVIATKPKDSTLDWYAAHGFERITEWPPRDGVERVLLWPPFRRPGDEQQQADTIRHALSNIFAEGVWTVVVDELHYATDSLGLGDVLTTYWRQGRSNGLSLVGSTQRPAHVPLDAYSAPRWLLLYRTSDRRDLDRLADISGDVDRDQLRRLVAALPPYALAVVDTLRGRVWITRAPARIPPPVAFAPAA